MKVSWTHLENVEQQATKEAPREFPFFLAHETPEKEEKRSTFFQSMNNSLACSLSSCRCTQWLTDVWKDNVIGFWRSLSPGERLHVCLFDICDTEFPVAKPVTFETRETTHTVLNTVISSVR